MSKARFFLITTVILWGWTFVATKIALQYMTPVELLGLRFLTGLPILGGVVFLKKLKFRFTSHEKRMIIAGSVIITVHFLLQITGLKYTSATNTGWIISITPLVLAVASMVFLAERLKRNAWIGILIASCGILVLISNGNLTSIGWLSSVGDWLVLASAHTWAIYTVVTRSISRTVNPLMLTFAVLLPSSVLILTYMAFTSDWGSLVACPTDGLLAVLYLGIFGLAIAHWFWQEGVSELGAARAGLFLYIEPLATTALAVPLLGEVFGLYQALGGGLVLAGVYFAERRGKVNRLPTDSRSAV